jgi:hypothetical protein
MTFPKYDPTQPLPPWNPTPGPEGGIILECATLEELEIIAQAMDVLNKYATHGISNLFQKVGETYRYTLHDKRLADAAVKDARIEKLREEIPAREIELDKLLKECAEMSNEKHPTI